MVNKIIRTPQEKLREKLYKINISENVSRAQIHSFDSKEFVKKAKEVRKTFKDENILFP